MLGLESLFRDIKIQVLFHFYLSAYQNLDSNINQMSSFITIRHSYFGGPWHPSTYYVKFVPSGLCLGGFLLVVSRWSVSGRGDGSVGKLCASQSRRTDLFSPPPGIGSLGPAFRRPTCNTSVGRERWDLLSEQETWNTKSSSFGFM